MIDIKTQPLASGKLKINVKIYQISNSRSPRFSLSTSLKPRVYWGKSKQIKKIIFNDYLHLPNKNIEEDRVILERWIDINELTNFSDQIFKKYNEFIYIYGKGKDE